MEYFFVDEYKAIDDVLEETGRRLDTTDALARFILNESNGRDSFFKEDPRRLIGLNELVGGIAKPSMRERLFLSLKDINTDFLLNGSINKLGHEESLELKGVLSFFLGYILNNEFSRTNSLEAADEASLRYNDALVFFAGLGQRAGTTALERQLYKRAIRCYKPLIDVNLAKPLEHIDLNFIKSKLMRGSRFSRSLSEKLPGLFFSNQEIWFEKEIIELKKKYLEKSTVSSSDEIRSHFNINMTYKIIADRVEKLYLKVKSWEWIDKSNLSNDYRKIFFDMPRWARPSPKKIKHFYHFNKKKSRQHAREFSNLVYENRKNNKISYDFMKRQHDNVVKYLAKVNKS